MTDLVESAEASLPAAGPAPVTGGTSDGAIAGDQSALAIARQEAATLRSVLTTIQEALAAALSRLEALEGQLNGELAATNVQGVLLPSLPAGTALARGVAEWKQPGWAPAGSGDVVSGDTLRSRREALGISQAAVAHAAHCSRGLVAEVERGKRRSAQTLSHLAAVLDRLEKQARRN